jgi:hypothetical protein
MLRKIFLVCGCAFLVVTVLLMATAFLSIGINDSERRIISQTGSFSKPDTLEWTPWGENNGAVVAFPGYHPERPRPALLEARRGHASGLFFDFTVYEGLTIRDDPTSAVPAIGPDWGAYYHAVWVFAAMAVAVIFIVLGFYTKE